MSTALGAQKLRLVSHAPLAGGSFRESPVSQSASFHRGGNHFPCRPLDAVSISKLPQGCSALNEGRDGRSPPVTLTPVNA